LSIAAADVDGDGDLDVLLGNYGSPSRMLLIAGGGTFPTSIELPGGIASTFSIAAADVDGDGDLDVLLGNDGGPSRVLLNAGDGTFPTSIELPGGSASARSVAAADVDGDGDLDLLLGNDGGPSRVLLNVGGGTFPTSIELPGGSASTRSIAAADVDGDGDLDVLIGNSGSPNRVLLNAGDGTFPTSIELPGGSASTSSIVAADVDGDGDLDVLFGNNNSPSCVLLNAGDGTFPMSIELPGGSTTTLSIAAADVDGDGDLDVLLGNYGSSGRVLLNAGDGTFPTRIELPGGSEYTFSIAAADVDGDGDLDVLLGKSLSPSHLLPFIRCSQPGTARSLFGNGCVRCPAPSSRRDDHFDVCYECNEHTELNVRGECSPCKPGYDRSLGGAECTACPRDEQCPHAPPTPPAALSAAARGMVVQPHEVVVLMVALFVVASIVALLVVLLVRLTRLCRKRRQMHKLLEKTDVSMQELSPRLSSGSGENSGTTVPSVRSDELSQLEVVDFSTLTMGRRIGQGGFATVWIARWQGNDLAIKVLNLEHENVDASTARQEVAMLQEVAILRRLRHPCICHLFGHMQVDQRPALVLEYMAGGSLAAYLFNPRSSPGEAVQAGVSSLLSGGRFFRQLIRPVGLNTATAPVAPQPSLARQLMEPPPHHQPPHPQLASMLPCDEKIRFGVQLASGLCFLHSHGILHSDVKTDNALLDVSHTVCKLSDFGLASLSLNYTRDRNKEYKATVGGTLRYLAPERVAEVSQRQARESRARGDGSGGYSGSHSLGRALVNFEDRADVYAFALLLWELAHQRRSFEGMTGLGACRSACRGDRPTIELPPNYNAIVALIRECWAQRPEERPSMSTVLERLETCMQALSATQRSASTEPSLSGGTSSSNFDTITMANSATAKFVCEDFLSYVPADGEHADK
jgi:serine/threonine protein kinase